MNVFTVRHASTPLHNRLQITLTVLQVARALKTTVATAGCRCREILNSQLFRFSFGEPTSPSHDLLQFPVLDSRLGRRENIRLGWRRNISFAFLVLLSDTVCEAPPSGHDGL
jgi:hypothetical protein